MANLIGLNYSKEVFIGDRIIAINWRSCYTTYKEWIDKYGGIFKDLWKEKSIPENEQEFQVVAKGPHLSNPEIILYYVAGERGGFIMGKNGIQLIKRSAFNEQGQVLYSYQL